MRVGGRPVGRNPPRLGIDDRRFAGPAEFDHVALQTAEIEMGRARRVGECRAPGMAQQPRQLGRRIDRRREFGDRRKQRRVRDFLIAVAVLKRRLLAAGQRYHRGVPEPRVLQSRGEVCRTHRLRHADPRLSRDAGIAVGHIGRGLFRMGEDAGDAEIVELQQCAAHDRLDEKDMRHPGFGQGARQPLGAVHRCCFAQLSFPPIAAVRRATRSSRRRR